MWKQLFKNLTTYALFLSLTLANYAWAAGNPDELYQKGHYAEAEKIYARSDMDHPKDIRYRYNRGCAAHQSSNYQVATAAFSSVLRRSEDEEIQFNAAYNLGNTAFNQRDFEAAVAHYKQAILFNPENQDAKYNLELALRKLEKQKKDTGKEPKTSPQEDSGQSSNQQNHTGEKQKKPSKEKKSREKSSPKSDQEQEGASSDKRQKTEKDLHSDLSGELKARQGLPEDQEGDQTSDSAMSIIDKRKAEALLDNINEDRSKFFHFQIPEDRKHGVPSGKDW